MYSVITPSGNKFMITGPLKQQSACLLNQIVYMLCNLRKSAMFYSCSCHFWFVFFPACSGHHCFLIVIHLFSNTVQLVQRVHLPADLGPHSSGPGTCGCLHTEFLG